jgi:hypothetical protein
MMHHQPNIKLNVVVHVNVMYMAEVAAVCIYGYFFQLFTVLQLLVIKQKPEKSTINSWMRRCVLQMCCKSVLHNL